MSNKINDVVADSLQEAVDENVERATFLQKKVSEKLEDFDLEGAMDLVSHAVKSNNDYWELQIEDINGLQHEENVQDHLMSEKLLSEND